MRVQAVGGDPALLDWQHIHNRIIAADPLSVDDIRARAKRNQLEVAYLENVAVGCSTVRPPEGDPAAATVIARVLPEHRRRGVGLQLYERGLARARELGAHLIETVVLASNDDGLHFAHRRGFVEVGRLVVPGRTTAYITLRLVQVPG